MTSNRKYGTIQNMINYTKKWWLLGCHYRAERVCSTKGSNDGNRVLVSKNLFIEGDTIGNKGLIHKYNSYVRFRFSYLIFWKKEYNEVQLKLKRFTYNNVYDICKKEGYITTDQGKQGDNLIDFPTVINPKAYNIRGFPLGYFQGLAKNYDKMWLAVGAIIVALIGSSLLTNRFNKADEPIQMPIVNNITTPDVNPIINIYPNATTTKK